MPDQSPDSKDVSPDGQSSPKEFIQHAENVMIREPYGPPGLSGLTSNPFVFLCAACSTLGGLVFGYDQGVVAVILVMDQFQAQFTRLSPDAPSSGFWKGLMTAMIELGALLGALNQGWIADKISRRYSILVAVVIFTIGSIIQTAAVDYAMLTVGRLIGGGGIGMLSMVAPLYISEISTYRLHESSGVANDASRSLRVSRDPVGPAGVVHSPGHCHCILDHIWYPVHSRGVVLATPVPAADGSRLCPRGRRHCAAVLSPVACFQG
jgi:hypothetical protein